MPKKDNKINVQSEIIEALAKKTTLNMWQISNEKNLYYSTVHKAVKTLQKEGTIQPGKPELSEKGGKTTPYRLTFRGFIKYLSSNPELRASITGPDIIDPLRKGESIEAYNERHEKEKEQHMKELEKITQFLETYGKVLDYALFKETSWLKDHYGHHVFDAILENARVIDVFQPFPSDAKQLIKHYHQVMNALKKQRGQMIRTPELQHKIKRTIVQGEIVETDYYDPLAEIDEKLKETELSLEILSRKEEEWWKRSFAAHFADWFQVLSGKGDMQNEALHGFFKQVAETNKKLEVEPAEKAAEIFRGSAV
jgi:predicted transcriptional regulator